MLCKITGEQNIMKRFTITLSITLLLFTSFAISLYGMKAGETDARGAATAPAPPPPVIDSESPVTGEHKDAASITAGIRDLKISKSDEATFLRYLFFNAPYHLDSIRGIVSPASNSMENLFYCLGETISPATVTDFFNKDRKSLPCCFWVHESQTKVTIELSKRLHFALPLRETAMIIKTADLPAIDLKEPAPCVQMGWDELDIFAQDSAAGSISMIHSGITAQDQAIFIKHLASSIPRERIRFYRAGSGKDVATCLTIDHPETRTVSLHFLPIKPINNQKYRNFLIQILNKAKTDAFVNVVMLVREDFYVYFDEIGFKPINGENAYLVHYFNSKE